MYRARGQAYETTGEFEPAWSDYEEALSSARTGADRRLEWQSLLDLGFLWGARDYDRAGEFFRGAMEP